MNSFPKDAVDNLRQSILLILLLSEDHEGAKLLSCVKYIPLIGNFPAKKTFYFIGYALA